jgi:hypothetical protein
MQVDWLESTARTPRVALSLFQASSRLRLAWYKETKIPGSSTRDPHAKRKSQPYRRYPPGARILLTECCRGGIALRRQQKHAEATQGDSCISRTSGFCKMAATSIGKSTKVDGAAEPPSVYKQPIMRLLDIENITGSRTVTCTAAYFGTRQSMRRDGTDKKHGCAL